MSIENIMVNTYPKIFGTNADEHNLIKKQIIKIITDTLKEANLRTLEVYNLSETHSYNVGVKNKKLVIFHNATRTGAGDNELGDKQTICGIETNYQRFYKEHGTGFVITSPEGIPLAEWFNDTFQLNILFNCLDADNEKAYTIFTYIMQQLNDLVLLPLANENSWLHTTNKQVLINKITTQLKKQASSQIARIQRNLEEHNDTARRLQSELKYIYDKIAHEMRTVESETKFLNNFSHNFIKDLDLLAQNTKIKDVLIKDNLLVVHTIPLIITDSNGRYFYGGNYRIELDIYNAKVHFFNKEGRRGYWTSDDPHPHVDGRSGEACLGNASGMIAELSSQLQIYAIILICIDFLESANLADSAGKYVINWDRVDEFGNLLSAEEIKEEDFDDPVTCDGCGDTVERDEANVVYESCYVDEEGNFYGEDEHMVCDRCLEQDYHYVDELDEYVLN